MAGTASFPSLFRRRLLALSVVMAAGLAVPAARLWQLTVAQGAEHRAQAEARLLTKELQPTTRGRVLDRKGRELARDVPSFQVEVSYPVISGEWAFTQAARAARRQAGARLWGQLSPVQREERVQALVPEFRRRLERDWAELALLAGVSEAELTARRNEIVAEVSRTARTVWAQRRFELEDELARGRELADLDITLAEVARPIREQRAAHVILRDVPDATAFRLLFATDPADDDQPERLELPGLRVVESSTRQTLLTEQRVLMNRRTFPGPLASEQPAIFSVRGAMTGIVGWMRPRPLAEDVQRRPRLTESGELDLGFYAPGDSVGAAGIEASAEDTLRGLRGLETRRLDTGQADVRARRPGQDVRLTIDADLQARVAALLAPEAGLAVVQPWQNNKALPAGTPLGAAAVVIEIATGDVLAMVSTPGFTLEDVREHPERLFDEAAGAPGVNRALSRPYAPGSIVKPLMYCAAVAEGVWPVDRRVECTGHLFPDRPTMFRCWIFKNPPHITHTQQIGHSLGPAEAIGVSCNIYFYSVGRALGAERIATWYERLGVGRGAVRPELGLSGQYAGAVGRPPPTPVSGRAGEPAEAPGVPALPESAADAEEMGQISGLAPAPPSASPASGGGSRGPRVSLSEATLMGIGQGPVAWTPLHAADAYATLARGGVRLVPRLRTDAPATRVDLGFTPDSVALAMEGLRMSVADDRGTGHHITLLTPDGTPRRENIFNAAQAGAGGVGAVTVWGKSGTADSGRRATDADGRPILDPAGRPVTIDHAWFVLLVGGSDGVPRYAVALLVEQGGSGGRVAGPLANQLIWALRHEGYL